MGKQIIILFGLFTCLLVVVSSAAVLDRDMGKIEVTRVVIVDGSQAISGQLYRPLAATPAVPAPAVVLAHGISGSKQMLSGIALELARQGLVSLSIDLVGHGDSGGVFGHGGDPSLGVSAAVRYLGSQAFVAKDLTALVGHSMGAGAIRAAASSHPGVFACVFIAGGLGSVAEGEAYGVLNSTFPMNLLVVVGKQDVLFDLTQLRRDLSPVFGVSGAVEVGTLYGYFQARNARMLITPVTTHLFEPVDPVVVTGVVDWMVKSLLASGASTALNIAPVYLYRDVLVLAGMAVFVCLVAFLFTVLAEYLGVPPVGAAAQARSAVGGWKISMVWGVLCVLAMLPGFMIGFFVPVQPFLFGASMAWWLLVSSLLGFAVAVFVLPRLSSTRVWVAAGARMAFERRTVGASVCVFGLALVMEGFLEEVLRIDFRIFAVPVFNALGTVERYLGLLLFIPFYLPYFVAEGLFLNESLLGSGSSENLWLTARAFVRFVAVKTIPFLALLASQYVPLFLFGSGLFPSSIGFFLEFFWGVLPMFVISSAISWWCSYKLSSPMRCVVLNAMLFAWSSAISFPYVGFVRMRFF